MGRQPVGAALEKVGQWIVFGYFCGARGVLLRRGQFRQPTPLAVNG